jgi:CBS-domain-containing membrane protein
MLVRDVMTADPVTVRTDTSVRTALELLDRHSITTLPVLSPAGLLVGAIGEADLIREAVRPDARAHAIPSQAAPRTRAPRRVVEVMNHRTVTVRADTDLAIAADLMTDTGVKSLPVIDEHHRVVGMVSRRDIIHMLARRDTMIEAEVDAIFHELGVDWLAEVQDGVVMLTGPENAQDRALAETAAGTVPGVVAVNVIYTPAPRR